MLQGGKPDSSEKGQTIPLLPLRDVVVFPHMMIPFVVGRQTSIRGLERATRLGNKIFLTAQQDPSIEDPQIDNVFQVGTVASIIQTVKQSNGNYKVLVEGLHRAELTGSIKHPEGFFEVNVQAVTEHVDITDEVQEQLRDLTEKFEKYIKISQTLSLDAMLAAIKTDNPSKLTDTIAAHLNIPTEQKQGLLETFDPLERIEAIVAILDSEMDKVRVDKRVNNRVRKQIERAQKEYYLNEKIKAIQKELGRGEKGPEEFQELREKIEAAKMSKEALEKAEHELHRLEAMPPMSAEATVSRNYIDWLISVPWFKKSRENRDIKRAEKVLNEDHYGLEEVKERILEYLAVRQLVKKIEGTILCFLGPPGVGKSTLARSIARAVNRKFVHFSLGGVRDEAEIRGHRRTYIGALPGQIIQMMKKAGTVNPVVLLDEVDKMSSDFRGDPSSALMEVLDPELNFEFMDHYIDVPYDLSQVMFITTANVIHTIPRPLQDRMEIIRIPGYILNEKMEIAKRHLIPRQLKAHGLEKRGVEFSDEVIHFIIEKYTWEAGLRNLERQIARIYRKLARACLEGRQEALKVIDLAVAEELLGVPKFRKPQLEKTNEVGLARGLAWTENGGDILNVEATLMKGKGRLSLTGKLGEVMQESAQAAMSYIRSRGGSLGVERKVFSRIDCHVHVPEGAIPKDGPSAGITIATALVSALTRVPVRNEVALTGEITLRGKVLPVGGVKEKVLAAHRAEISTIILPQENEKDLRDVPEEVRRDIQFVYVDTMDQVLEFALVERLVPLPDIEELLDEIAKEDGEDRMAGGGIAH
ncbi:MAG TPA: endopeptidase La [Acidobacteriota bacterium]|nr:endopeptidase La [Acidobacteriota bacterium]